MSVGGERKIVVIVQQVGFSVLLFIVSKLLFLDIRMSSAARDLDLNSGEPPFEVFDSHIATNPSSTVLGFNLNEDCTSKPSLITTVEFEGNSSIIEQHEHGLSESYDPLVGVENVVSAEVGDDALNGKDDGQSHLGLDSAGIVLESNGFIGISPEDAEKEDGLSGKVSPKENPKVSPLEEDFDRHPVKSSDVLHETSSTVDNGIGHPKEEGDCMSREDGIEISVGDLVWGKVKSHPWWPGQVFDPSDASELARQHQKKDRLLVAYFGDETFAWVEKCNLKRFQDNFAELSKQSTGKAFGKAVGQAVDEVARRLQIGLACKCLSDQTCIKNKAISSVGLCKGALVANSHIDVTAFDPQKLLNSVQELAKHPSTDNTLEIATFIAQVSVFYALHRHSVFGKSSSKAFLQDESGFKSGMVSKRTSSTPKHVKTSDDYSPLKETQSSNKKQSLKKRKRLFDDSQGYDVFEDEDLPIKDRIETPKRFVKESAESVSARKASLSATKKTRTGDHIFASGSDRYLKGSKTQHVKKDMHRGSPKTGEAGVDTKRISKAFKLGECISKIASQLSGSPSIIKSVDPTAEDTPEKGAKNNDEEESPSSFSKSPVLVMEESSVKEILVELYQVAQDPMQCLEENDIFSRVTSVFLKFRDEEFEKDSVYPSYRRSSRSSSKLVAASYMDDDSDDMSDIDKRIVSKRKGHSPGRPLKRKAESRGRESAQKSKNHSILSNSSSSKKVKKLQDHVKFPDSISSEGPPLSNAEDLKDSSEENPTALFIQFPPGVALPSELELKEMFGSFGQIAETQFFSDSGCAQVIFRRCSDAEAAFHGATANKVFGPVTVSFRLRYLSSKAKTQNDDLRKDEMSIMSEEGRNP